MKYACLPKVAFRFAVLAAIAWFGIGSEGATASTIVVPRSADHWGNSNNWQQKFSSQWGGGYGWNDLAQSPDAYIQQAFTPTYALADVVKSGRDASHSGHANPYSFHVEIVADDTADSEQWAVDSEQ